MFQFILAIVLLLLALVSLTLRKTYYYLPKAELKRQARAGDKLAALLYKAVAYDANLRLLLWLLIGISAAFGLVLFVRIAPVYLGILVVAIVLWLGFAWMPSTRLTAYGARLAVWLTPAVVRLLAIINPVFSRITEAWHRYFPLPLHSGLYEQEDLLRLIEQQRLQPDNRMSEEVLDLASRALQFDKRKVVDITVPRKQVKVVGLSETVGPILLDELHASGHTRFPVYKKDVNDIVGTLQLITLDEAKQGGKVSDFTDKKVAYLHEKDSLADGLRAVYRTKQQLFVVVNSFDEYVGIVTLEDILYALLGTAGDDDFDMHHNRQLVAAKHARKPESKPTEEEKISETSPEVVE